MSGNIINTISPKPGFDWSKVEWGGPHERVTDHCSYCGKLFPDDDERDFVPLILWTKAGSCAQFCEVCQSEWWGIWSPKADEL